MSNHSKFQIQWGGAVGNWRPAITGTLNQTGEDDDTRAIARRRARGIPPAIIANAQAQEGT